MQFVCRATTCDESGRATLRFVDCGCPISYTNKRLTSNSALFLIDEAGTERGRDCSAPDTGSALPGLAAVQRDGSSGDATLPEICIFCTFGDKPNADLVSLTGVFRQFLKQ
jgi:hypothetical protein